MAVPKVALPGLRLLAKVPGRAVTSYPGPGDPARSLNTLPLPNRGPFPTLKDRRQGFSGDARKMARGQKGKGGGIDEQHEHSDSHEDWSLVLTTRPAKNVYEASTGVTGPRRNTGRVQATITRSSMCGFRAMTACHSRESAKPRPVKEEGAT